MGPLTQDLELEIWLLLVREWILKGFNVCRSLCVASCWKCIGACLGHRLVLGCLEIGLLKVYKCTFGGCKCWFECSYCLNAYLMHLSCYLSWLSTFVHLWVYWRSFDIKRLWFEVVECNCAYLRVLNGHLSSRKLNLRVLRSIELKRT